MFDVLVIGAGPAGSVAALVLARAGVRVCLVDRCAFPRPKLCGDTLNPGVVALLGRLGVLEPLERAALRIEGMRVTGDGVAVDARYGAGLRALALDRRALDLALVRAASAAGAEIRERVVAREPLVDERTGARTVAGAVCTWAGGQREGLRARVTIAADGRRSVLAHALGLTRHPPSPRRWAIGTYATDVHGMSAVGEMHIRPGQYIGVAPLPGGMVNVCVVRPAAPADPAFRNPGATLAYSLAGDPMLRDRFADARMAGKPVVMGPLAVDVVPGTTPPSGLLLAGDAAGFVDPMTGDGLRFAVRGGELAAQAALRALEGGWTGVQASLAAARQREFAGKLRFNRLLRGLVASPAGVRSAAVGGRLAPGLVRMLVQYAGDCALAAAGQPS